MSIEIKESDYIMTPEDAAFRMQRLQQLKERLIDRKTDLVAINGKPFMKRSGFRKLALAFRISTDIVKEETIYDENKKPLLFRCHVKASEPSGRMVVAVAACTIEERVEAKSKHAYHDAYAIAQTRATNRAISDLIGSGEVSAEEIEDENTKQFADKVNAKAQAVFK